MRSQEMEKIRSMKKEDMKACAQILEDAYSKEPYNTNFSPGSALKYIESKFKNGKDSSFVLEVNGEIKGFAISSISHWANGPQAIVEEIAVSEDSRRKGFATKLNDHLEKYFKSIGVTSAMLWTKRDSPAVKFHKHNGYREENGAVAMFKLLDKKV